MRTLGIMKATTPFIATALLFSCGVPATHLGDQPPTVRNFKQNVTYTGLSRNEIEIFLNIHYGEDTSGANRFKHPQLHVPSPNTTIRATSYGPACPQPLGVSAPPLAITEVTEISEDCLHLNIARPKGTKAGDKLPVLVFIHGGGFWIGQNREITNAPDGMILESVKNRLPIIYVAIQYRLGAFGFAQSEALRSEKSLNAGLLDQRLALEWVRDNIVHFGGDASRITAWGQSSGGLAVGMQTLAYGGSKPLPFQKGICHSQAVEPGITGNFTPDAMQLLVNAVGCNKTGLHSPEAVACLRALDMETLMDAAAGTYLGDIAHNVGDIWLPTVDGDFLPAAPSTLLREGSFTHGVTSLVGWADDDLNIYTFLLGADIKTSADSKAFIHAYVPGVSEENIDRLLALYPVSEWSGQGKLSAEFYRTARVFRDILMVCQPIWYGEQLSRQGADVFLYDWNQTILEGPIQKVLAPGGPLGPVHTAEFAYVYGNLSHYDVNGYPFAPTAEDVALTRRGSRSWSTFVATGVPGGVLGKEVFQGVRPAYSDGQVYVHVSGGPGEGVSSLDGSGASPAVAAQKLKERCTFINTPEMIEQFQF